MVLRTSSAGSHASSDKLGRPQSFLPGISGGRVTRRKRSSSVSLSDSAVDRADGDVRSVNRDLPFRSLPLPLLLPSVGRSASRDGELEEFRPVADDVDIDDGPNRTPERAFDFEGRAADEDDAVDAATGARRDDACGVDVDAVGDVPRALSMLTAAESDRLATVRKECRARGFLQPQKTSPGAIFLYVKPEFA